jgi:DNA-binding MarR family transcriptional regulator
LLRLYATGGAPVVRLLEGRYGISRREWRLLAMLVACDALSPSALADAAHLDRPRTSRAIGTLTAKGLIEREPQPGDHRRACVRLTGEGRRLFDEIFPQVAAINAELVAVLDASQQTALDEALSALTQQAERLNALRVLDVRADRRAGGSRRVRRGVDPGAELFVGVDADKELASGPGGCSPSSKVHGGLRSLKHES